MKSKFLSTLLFLIFIGLQICAQTTTTITLQPSANEGKSNTISSWSPNVNYPDLDASVLSAWTINGSASNHRTLIEFDLSKIPSNAIIKSANLSLYYTAGNTDFPTHQGENAFSIQRITSPWQENLVTWNTKPTSTNENQVLVSKSYNANQNYTDIDVKALVIDMQKSNNYGFMMQLLNESPYACVVFASSNNPNPALRPKLEICYTIPNPQNCITLQPGANDGKDALLPDIYPDMNVGDVTYILPSAFTISGTNSIQRHLIEFDFSKIPSNAIIESAKLSLYYIADNSDFPSHIGENTFSIQRVTSLWQENFVTWNTKPTSTTENQVIVPKSYNANQNYTDIDVKALVVDMQKSNNYGFMLQLLNETPYAYVILASSDHPNSALHPKIEICYTIPDPVTIIEPDNCISLQPNALNGKDVQIESITPNGVRGVTNGNLDHIYTSAWTQNGVINTVRSLIEFDLSQVPANADITEAKLSFFCDRHNIENTDHTGNNSLWIKRITSPWNEQTVTWNSKPTTTTENQISIAQSTSPSQDYKNIDVKTLVTDMLRNKNFGIMLQLQNETPYSKVALASSNNPNPELRPKLEICYKLRKNTDNCISIQPNSSEGIDAQITNNELNSNFCSCENICPKMWNKNNTISINRNLLKFNLSNIPANAIIDDARLSLYFNPNSTEFVQHFGNNSLIIQRITSNWNVKTVTWNNQPTSSAIDQIIIPKSSSPAQNYTNIDVKNLVLKMAKSNNDNQGFMLRLENENSSDNSNFYSSNANLIFASSDNPDSTIHPKLVVCYSYPNKVEKQAITKNTIICYPNPMKNSITFETSDNTFNNKLTISILNNTGHEILKVSKINLHSNKITIERGNIKTGLYLYKIENGENISTGKIIVTD